jgi:twitching motility two-component system response regulator PilG
MQKILIVEDDADLVETYTDLLESNHYSVTSTPKAKEAVILVTRIKPNVVLLDLNLAGYSGAVVINMIRGYNALKDTKIVVVTGHPEMLRGSVDEARVDLILSKPVSNDMLLKTVHQFAPLSVS